MPSDQLILLDRGTEGTEAIESPTPPSETMPAVSSLTEDIGFLRSRTRAIHEDVGNLHREFAFAEWKDWTNRRARSSTQQMLSELADLGLAWRDMARLIGVSVPAIQKWRRAQGTTGENRRRVASLLAACDMVCQNYGIQEIASWLEMPLHDEVSITPMDLWVAARVDLLFDFASGHMTSDEILTELDPDWRERQHSDFEVFKAGDGQLSVRLKER